MINCPKCEADNQIGAIFCRSCGEKLELDEIKPDTVRKGAKKQVGSGINWFSWIKNLVMLGFLVVVVGILVGLFLTPAMPGNAAEGAKAKAAMDKVSKYQRGQATSIVLDEEELNSVIKYFLLITDDELDKARKEFAESGSSGMMMEEMRVDLLDDNRVRLVMKQQHTGHDMIKYYSIAEGELKIDETTKHATFEMDKCAQGRVPLGMLDFTREIVSKRFMEQYRGKQELQQIVGSLKSIKVTDDKIILKGQMKVPGRAPVKSSKKKSRRRRR